MYHHKIKLIDYGLIKYIPIMSMSMSMSMSMDNTFEKPYYVWGYLSQSMIHFFDLFFYLSLRCLFDRNILINHYL